MKAFLVRMLRYGLVGLATNAAGYLLYLLVTWAGVEPKLAVTFLYPVGAALGYFGNRRFAFDYGGSYFWSLAKYVFAHLCGYGLNFLLLLVFVDRLGFPHQVVQAAAIFAVAGFLFLLFNFVVFPQRRSDSESA